MARVPHCPACDNALSGLRLTDPRFSWSGELAVQCGRKRKLTGDRAERTVRCEAWLVVTRTHTGEVTVREMTTEERRRAA